MRSLRTVLVVLISGAVGAVLAAQRGGGTRVTPGQECPPGTTEVRPGSCMAPSEAPPSILDYRPRNTLVVPEHKVPKAKFPVDRRARASRQRRARPTAINRIVAMMDSLNIRVMLVAENVSGQRLTSTMAALNASPHKDRFRVLAGINFRNVGPGWGERAAQQLEADIKAGAIGVGEVRQAFGLRITKPDGSRLKVDDPDMDPLWAAFARLDVPAFIHTAEPQEFFQPLDLQERALARARAVRGSAQQPARTGDVRTVDDRAQQPVPQAPEDALRARRISAGTPTTWRGPARCSTSSRTSRSRPARSSTTSAASRAPRASSS